MQRDLNHFDGLFVCLHFLPQICYWYLVYMKKTLVVHTWFSCLAVPDLFVPLSFFFFKYLFSVLRNKLFSHNASPLIQKICTYLVGGTHPESVYCNKNRRIIRWWQERIKTLHLLLLWVCLEVVDVVYVDVSIWGWGFGGSSKLCRLHIKETERERSKLYRFEWEVKENVFHIVLLLEWLRLDILSQVTSLNV